MSQLLRKLQSFTDTHSSLSGFTKLEKSSSFSNNRREVPKGYLPVHVGKDHMLTRFVIEAKVVNHHLFAELLQASAQEYGYEQSGALRIPCDVMLFENVLRLINRERERVATLSPTSSHE